MVDYEVEARDAGYWHEKLKKILGDKLIGVSCINETPVQIHLKDELTPDEKVEVEKVLDRKVKKFIPPPPPKVVPDYLTP